MTCLSTLKATAALFALGILTAFIITASAAPAYQGYIFCASGSNGYLIDPTGAVVHTWHASGTAQTCGYLLADGSALFPIQNSQCTQPHHDGAYPSGRFQKIAWDGSILWDYRFCDSSARAGYDVHPMPNGNILIPTDARYVGKIFEVQPTGPTSGTIVWQCFLPDSLTGSNTYMNSVAYNPELDQIVIDMQEPVRKCVVIDHSVPGGQIVRTFRVAGTGRLHAATWVHRYFLGTAVAMPDVDPTAMRLNNILVVHNGGDRVAEFNVASGAMTTIPFAFDDHEGSVQRLPNGNTLVTRGGSATIVELDDAGHTVRTIYAPGQIQRAYCWGPTFPGLRELFPENVTESIAASPTLRFCYDRGAETGRLFLADPTAMPVTLRVFSVNGRLLDEMTTWDEPLCFSTRGFSSGMYYISAQQGESAYSTRFVIVR